MNLSVFWVEGQVRRHGSSDLPVRAAHREAGVIKEAAPRGGSKRWLQDVSPRGGSKRRLKEVAGDVQEEAPSSKRWRQKVAPKGGWKRQLQEAAPRGRNQIPISKKKKKLFKKKKKKKKKKSTSLRLPEALTPRLPATVEMYSIFIVFCDRRYERRLREADPRGGS